MIDYEGEYIAAESIARHFGVQPENCVVQAEGIEPERMPFGCSADPELARFMHEGVFTRLADVA